MVVENGKKEGSPVVENGKTVEKEEGSPVVVKVIGKSMVVPTRKQPEEEEERRHCPLVTFDLPYITFYYNQKLLVYQGDGGGEYEKVVGKLKEGLAAALGYFYPLAGKLGRDEEGVLRVECSGESLVGAEVVEAVADGVGVAELDGGDAPPFLQELVPYSGVMNLEGLHRPLLAMQFTRLKDGLAIGCAFDHAVLDGRSTWHFMGAWAELCRAGPTATVSPLPFHDRTRARTTRVKLDLPPSAAAHEAADPSGAPKPLREKIFSFSEKSVAKIKSDTNAAHLAAAKGSDAPKPFSTFQSLGAHVWRAVCRARCLPPEAPTVFAVFADCRRRVDPPVPEGYFGNLIQAIFTGTASGLLLASPPEFGAGLVQSAIGAHDARAIAARLEEYEAAPRLFYYKDAGVNTVAVGSSPRFPVYEVDFGFGAPKRVRSGANNKFDGMMYLYAGRDGGGGIDAEITLEVEAMANLEKDEELLMMVN